MRPLSKTGPTETMAAPAGGAPAGATTVPGVLVEAASHIPQLIRVLQQHQTVTQQDRDATVMDFGVSNRNMQATQSNTAATAANSAAMQSAGTKSMIGGIIGGIGSMLGGPLGGLIFGGGKGHAEGGVVAETGFAKVHAGEVIANAQIMENIGKNLSSMPKFDMRNVTQQLSRAPMKDTGSHVHMEGNNWYGTFTQDNVNQIMNTAVGQLRRSSRTWAFNPVGQ
jgi:hypothetical protein